MLISLFTHTLTHKHLNTLHIHNAHTHAHTLSTTPVIYEDIDGKEAVQMYETIQEINNKPYQKVPKNQISRGYDENDAYGPHHDNEGQTSPQICKGYDMTLNDAYGYASTHVTSKD